MPRRNRVFSVVAFPIVILLWFIGWSLFWLNSKKDARIIEAKPLIETGITFTVPLLEQPQETQQFHSA